VHCHIEVSARMSDSNPGTTKCGALFLNGKACWWIARLLLGTGQTSPGQRALCFIAFGSAISSHRLPYHLCEQASGISSNPLPRCHLYLCHMAARPDGVGCRNHSHCFLLAPRGFKYHLPEGLRPVLPKDCCKDSL
jgi:hypothetical protein